MFCLKISKRTLFEFSQMCYCMRWLCDRQLNFEKVFIKEQVFIFQTLVGTQNNPELVYSVFTSLNIRSLSQLLPDAIIRT